MEESDDQESTFGSVFPPSLVSLTPFTFTPSASPSPRRLSNCFTQPTKPIRAKRQLAWVSLQGRLVGAEEATSAKAIDRNGALSAKEAVAWELFTPIQRVLLVAVVAAAAANSKKSKHILNLQKSVELRDKVLLSMQKKLDNLCQQVDYFKDQPEVVAADDVSLTKKMNCGCKPCQQHRLPPDDVILGNKSALESNGDELIEYETPLANGFVEPEERRLSDLSDWAPSVTSSVDIQLDNFAIEHSIRNLQKECEEKDAIIKKLSTSIQSSQVSSSKRNMELEDIIRRKNTIINKLRKDVIFLEHKVMNLSRLRRSSFSSATTASSKHNTPFMADNVLYDMDNTTSASSDSDSSPGFKTREICFEKNEKDLNLKGDRKCGQFKSSKLIEPLEKPCVRTPLKQLSLNQTPNRIPDLKPKHISSGENITRRRPPPRSKEVNAPKRWV